MIKVMVVPELIVEILTEGAMGVMGEVRVTSGLPSGCQLYTAKMEDEGTCHPVLAMYFIEPGKRAEEECGLMSTAKIVTPMVNFTRTEAK